MQIYDISQEVFGCDVYPGDPVPKRQVLTEIKNGAVCNLTAFSMCAHNGTHVDAPYHFFEDGKRVDDLSLESLVGYAYVSEFNGVITAEDSKEILDNARNICAESEKRILIKGKATLSLEAAEVFAEAGIKLFGNESQTVGPEQAPAAVHKVLLRKNIILLEGIRLSQVPVGIYLLSAAPILLGGADGAPCRAFLIKEQ